MKYIYHFDLPNHANLIVKSNIKDRTNVELFLKKRKWFLNSKTKDAIITIDGALLIWNDGHFIDGIWKGSSWNNGTFHNGLFKSPHYYCSSILFLDGTFDGKIANITISKHNIILLGEIEKIHLTYNITPIKA